MNSCGQHGLAHIGFHGSSMKVEGATVPALQVLLGGGNNGFGLGRIAEKVIKLPSKRVLECIRSLINDYLESRSDNELFNEYYDRQGNKYFYDLLKPLADTTQLNPLDYIDWGQEEQFKTAIGVGECAGVVIDLVATLIFDAEEKIDAAQEALAESRFADAIYHTYAAGIHTAKALLLGINIRCNTHQGIINDFDQYLVHDYQFEGYSNFEELILQIRMREAGEAFAKSYLAAVTEFIEQVKAKRLVV
jgi:sulfite reductase (ferredoxin)